MFTIPPHRSIITLAKLCPRLNQFIFRVPSCTPLHPLRASALLRSPSLQPHWGQQQFSTSSRQQVQYTRFSNGHTYHSRRPDRDKVVKILVFVTAAGGVYYVAQYVDKRRLIRAVHELHL